MLTPAYKLSARTDNIREGLVPQQLPYWRKYFTGSAFGLKNNDGIFFASLPLPFRHTPTDPSTTTSSPTNIPSYIFRFHPFNRFLPESDGRQTDRPCSHYDMTIVIIIISWAPRQLCWQSKYCVSRICPSAQKLKNYWTKINVTWCERWTRVIGEPNNWLDVWPWPLTLRAIFVVFPVF